MTKKPMTIEEMEKRWPECPPYDARHICIMEKGEGRREINFEVTQDTIQEIRDYLDAVEECLNG